MSNYFYLISGSAGETGSLTSPTFIMTTYRANYPGTSSTNQNSVASNQITNTAGGTILSWVSPPCKAFTLSGSATMSIWGYEQNVINNASVGFRLWHKSSSLQGTGSETAMMTSIVSGSELGATVSNNAVISINSAITDTVFKKNDRIILRLYSTGINGAAAGNGTTTMFYGGTTSGSSGDAVLTFSQDVKLKNKFFVAY